MQKEKGQLLFSSSEGASSGTIGEVRSARKNAEDERKKRDRERNTAVESPEIQAAEDQEMFEIPVSELTEDHIRKSVDEMLVFKSTESESKNEEKARLREQAQSLGIEVGKKFSKASYREALVEAIKSGKLAIQETAEERRIRMQAQESVESVAIPEPEVTQQVVIEQPKEQMVRIGGTDADPIFIEASKIKTRPKNLTNAKEVVEPAQTKQETGIIEPKQKDFTWIAKTLEKAKSGMLDSKDLGPMRNALGNPDVPEEIFLPAYKAVVSTWVINGGRRQKENIARFQASEAGERYNQIIARQIEARRKNEPAPKPREPRETNLTPEQTKLRGLNMEGLRVSFKIARDKRDTDKGLAVLAEAERRYDKLIAKETNPTEKRRLEFAKSEILADRQAIQDSLSGERNQDRTVRPTDPSAEIRRKEKETKLTRDAAQITLARIPKYGENDVHPLWAETEAEGNKKFKEISLATWKEFALHGLARKRGDSDQYDLVQRADLDGRIALQLLEEAGFDISQREYVPQGESQKGKINIDTGDKEGLVVEDEGVTAYFDHHAPESRDNNSATKIMFEVLSKLGFLDRKQIRTYEKVVDFVNKTDNMLYPADAYGAQSARTMVGLRRSLTFRQMITLFDKYKPTDVIPDDVLRRMKMPRERGTLWDESEKRRIQMEQDIQRLDEMKQEGLVVDSEDYGPVVVDIYGSLKTGADVAKASGAGAFIKWMPQTKSFFLSTFRIPLKQNHKFSQGKPIRDTMWIKPQSDNEPLNASLEEVVGKLTNGNVRPSGELKKYIDSPETYRLAVSEQEIGETKARIEELIAQAQSALLGDKQVKPGKLRGQVEQELAKLSSNTNYIKTPELRALADQNRADVMAKLEAYERAFEREKILREVAAEEWDNTFAEMLDERKTWGYTDQEISNYLQSAEHAQFMNRKQEIINNTLVELRTL